MKWQAVSGSQNRNLYKRGNAPSVWVRFSKAGKRRLEKSLHTANVGAARIKRDIEIAAYLNQKAEFQGAALCAERFEEWRGFMNLKSPGTIASIANQWKIHLEPYFGRMPLHEITANEWSNYVIEKRKTDPDRKFFNDRKWLSMFLIWCNESGYIEKLPKLEDYDPTRKKGKVYKDAELDALVLHAEPDLHLQIQMAVTMGMRRGEILSLEWSQIDWDRGTIHLPAEKTKIRQERTFVMAGECATVLAERAKRGVMSRWVFPSPTGADRPIVDNKTAWTRCRRLAGVTGTFHHLRHTFLTRAFKTSENPMKVCTYAGLSMDEAQRTYLHLTAHDTRSVADLVTL